MLETGTESALVAERRVGRRQRRLFSCHIISDRAVNKGPLRPPGPLHSRIQVGARFNSPSAARLSTTATLCGPPCCQWGLGGGC